jgi:hypothetical protein
LKAVIIATVFGCIALAIVLSGIHLPIPGTTVVTDPRELFTTIGSALTGPIGGIVIGFLAGVAEPQGIPLASILAHLLGGLFMGIVYKNIVYKKIDSFQMYLFWPIAVLAYYFIIVVPGFAVGLNVFYNDPTPILDNYLAISKGAFFESIFTSIVTALGLYAIPKKYIKPLW